jgi:hypothetical protein
MIHNNWWTPKGLILAAAMLSLAGAAVFVAIGLAYPEPVSNAALGPDWQCSRVAYVWTSCSRPKHAEAASVRLAAEPVCRRLRGAGAALI